MIAEQHLVMGAWRLLQQSGAAVVSTSDGGEDIVDDGNNQDETKGLRIAAVFIIFAAGLAGSLPCLFFPVFRSASHPVPRVLRALSAGIIVALALVHVFPDAVEDFDKLVPLMNPDYPYNAAGPCAIFGALLMVALESAAMWWIDRNARRATRLEQVQRLSSKHQPSAKPQPIAESSEETLCGHPDLPYGPPPPAHTTAALTTATAAPPPSAGALSGGPMVRTAPAAHLHPTQHHPHPHHPHLHPQHQRQAVVQLGDPHVHACMGSARLSLEATPTPHVRDQVLAVLFELGCIFHSVIIGVALGVDTDSKATVRGLVVALCFHQWLEGIPLASFIMRARIRLWKAVAMIVAYSLTCPIGIAIGIAVSGSYDPASTQAAATQGVFNAVSAGMLLYISLVQLVAEDFSRRELVMPAAADDGSALESPRSAKGAKHLALPAEGGEADEEQGGQAEAQLVVAPAQGWLLVACHVAMWLGAACMSLLAIWA